MLFIVSVSEAAGVALVAPRRTAVPAIAVFARARPFLFVRSAPLATQAAVTIVAVLARDAARPSLTPVVWKFESTQGTDARPRAT